MDFNDTREQAAFRAEARAWLDANAELLAPGEKPESMFGQNEETLRRAQAWQAKKADAGWACITWPVEYGGRGATAIQSVIWNQEEPRYRVPPSMFSVGQGMLGPTIMIHGTEAQKKRYLRPLLRGEEVWCQLFSEPAAGSDLAGLRTRAVRDGDHWVVNGQKIWTSGAQFSRWGMLLTRTNPGAAKHAGITYFIVDMESSGIEIRPIKEISEDMDFNEVFFNDVRIPAENLIGEVDGGWRCAITTLMNERATVSGVKPWSLGAIDLMEMARGVSWNGGTALDDPSVRQRVAEFYVKVKGLEYTKFRTLTALSRGDTPGPENSINKMVGSKLVQDIASFALEIQGAAGVTRESALTPLGGGFQHAYLAQPGRRIAGGTDEIMRNIVAERVLGLPGEIRVDKSVAFKDVATGRD